MIKSIKLDEPKYQSQSLQIVNLVKSQISQKQLCHGAKLPTIEELARLVGVGNYSVRQAIAMLSAEGIVNTVRGSGTYVVNRTVYDNSRLPKKATRNFCLISAFRKNGKTMELYHPVTTAAILDECKKMKTKGRFLSPDINLSSIDGIIEEMNEYAYDGAIWLYPIADQWSVVKSLHDRKIPIVATAHSQYAVNVPCVQGNEVGAGQVMGRYLVNQGCKKIIIFSEQDKPDGNVRDVRSGYHVGGRIGLLNSFEEAGAAVPDITEAYFTYENYRDMLKKAFKDIDKRTCFMLPNTVCLQDYLRKDLPEAVSLLSKCELIIATSERDCHLLCPLAKEVEFMVSIHQLGHIGKAAVQKLVHITEGQFEDTTTLVNDIFEKFNPDRKDVNSFNVK